jgi:hypothetical protein
MGDAPASNEAAIASPNSFMFIRNEMNFPSTEDIQHTFVDFQNNKIISYVDYFPEAEQCRCHIFSYPSLMQYYSHIANNFQVDYSNMFV